MRESSLKMYQVRERMEGVSTENLCEFVLTAVWKDPPPVNMTGVNGQAMHAHAIESLVYRVKEARFQLG